MDLRFKLYPPPSSCDDHKSIDNNVTDTHRELARVDTLLIGYLENSHYGDRLLVSDKIPGGLKISSVSSMYL